MFSLKPKSRFACIGEASSVAWLILTLAGGSVVTGCSEEPLPGTTTGAGGVGAGGQGGGGAEQGGMGGSMSPCGNGAIDSPETCDDQNLVSGDGCDSGCNVELGYTCEDEPSVCRLCGNEKTEANEGCDDGNTVVADGCNSVCEVEIGYWCAGMPSVCTPGCGDGFLSQGEPCDDANSLSGDGCSYSCVVEPGYVCTGIPSSCTSTCGDGVVVAGEPCDDGNVLAGDGCTSECEIEAGYACGKSPSICTAGCGDGGLSGSEACDDGNLISGDGCNYACVVEMGYVCPGSPSICNAQCGDGIVAGAESCDDGGIADGDCCSSQCQVEAGCETEPNDEIAIGNDFDVIAVNQVLKGKLDSLDDVDAFRVFVPPGTRGTLTAKTLDGFATTCASFDLNSTLRVFDKQGSLLAYNDDTATDLCSLVSVPGLYPGEHVVVVGRSLNGGPFDYSLHVQMDLDVCGDGAVVSAAAEQCDDGNSIAGDGCSLDCAIESGYSCAGTPSTCYFGCGNGLVNGFEECDDSDLESADGCSAVCVREPGFTCSGMPSECITTCGDSIVAGNETCDDGNTISGDCCSANCQADPKCEIEPNNTTVDANSFAARAVADQLIGRIAPAGDKDYFYIDIPPGAVGTISAESSDGPSSTCESLELDTRITLLDSAANPLASDDDGAPLGFCSSVTATDLAEGRYYIDVRASEQQPSATFDYTLTTLVSLSVCGNSIKEPGEQCDDGDLANGDGCGADCYIELPTETEPNNTLLEANDLGLPLPIVLKGSIVPRTDADFFVFTIPATVDLVVETFDKKGPGSCDLGSDTTIALYGPDKKLIVANDEGGINSCSKINPLNEPGARHLAPGQYYVRVKSYGDEQSIPVYNLSVSYAAYCGDGKVEGSEECEPTLPNMNCDSTCQNVPTCGDGKIDGDETCDDSNTADLDGCSGTTCQIEGPDVEPNNTIVQANKRAMDPVPVHITGDKLLSGSIGALGDRDTYKMTLATPSVVRLETFDATGIDCSAGMATTLRLFDSTGTELAFNHINGIANCSALTKYMLAGDYYVQVEEFGNDAALNGYKLEVDVLGSAGNESEQNPTKDTADAFAGNNVFIVGGHLDGADTDYFAITVEEGKSVRAEIIEGNGEQCKDNGVDSLLTLYNAMGVKLVEDDDEGRGNCSMIDGSGNSPLHAPARNLTAGTYYLAVRASMGATGAAKEFEYRLCLTMR